MEPTVDTAGSGAPAERVAEHADSFRDANEAIHAKARGWEMTGLLPTICECADTSCTELLHVTAAQYEAVRGNSRWFINAPGHHAKGQGWARVVAEYELYIVVEKIGEVGEIVERLDPRSVP